MKNIIFAVVRGFSKKDLASRIGCTVDHAEKMQIAILDKFSMRKSNGNHNT